MRKLIMAILTIISMPAFAQDQDMAFLYISKFYNDSIYHPVSSNSYLSPSAFVKNEFAGFNLATILRDKKPVKKVLGYTKKNRPVEIHYFPGSSNKKALVIGGIHGSELSSIEVANQLLEKLSSGEVPYYSVIVIPTLFPDNAAVAEDTKKDRILNNAGRYTNEKVADPNRQMPLLNKPFRIDEPIDAQGRSIEIENALLLQLIQAYAPERILSLHAIKDKTKGGIYADPRTDCEGRALGFSTDSTLAVQMATFIETNGGAAPGNDIRKSPTALYYLDPKNAPVGQRQERNLKGSNHSQRSHGVSLGGWASTAVCDENNYTRSAMRILTMEFPGYKKTTEYKSAAERNWNTKQVGLYAGSILRYFLQEVCVEEELPSVGDSLVIK